jgi:hypothetical protein
MMSVVEDMHVDERQDDNEPDLSWEDAVAEFEAGEPVELVRPPRKITIVYRYTDGRFYATSPDLTGFEVSGPNLYETKQLVREDLARYLDPTVEFGERFPTPNRTEGMSNSSVTHGDQFLALPHSVPSSEARAFISGHRLKVS